MSQRIGFVRRHRMGIASVVVFSVAVASVLVYALATRGNPAREAHLNDAGVWVSTNNPVETSDTAGSFGLMNVPATQFEKTLIPQGSATDLDVYQDGFAAFGYDRQAHTLTPFDASKLALSANVVNLGTGVPAIGGDGETGTLAVVADGKLYASRFSTDDSLTVAGTVDPHSAKAIVSVGAKAAIAVGVTGAVYAVSPSAGLTVVTPRTDGTWTTTSTKLPSCATCQFTVTAVGSQPVALETSAASTTATLVLPSGKTVELDRSSGGDAVLQQPGPADKTSSVLVATTSELLAYSLKTGTSRRVAAGSGGAPAQPVWFQSCAWGAWADPAPTEVTVCGDKVLQKSPSLPTQTGQAVTGPLTFRVNHDELLLNDRASGQVWDEDNGVVRDIADWQDSRPPTPSDQQGRADQAGTSDQTKAPTAHDDTLGARPGRTTVLHVLDNDSTPANTVLTVNQVNSPPADSRVVSVAPAPDRQSILVSLAGDATGTFSFTYNDANGGAKPSADAKVVVKVVPFPTYFAPNPRQGFTQSAWSVPVNGTITIPVINDWRVDDDGDPPALDPITAGGVRLQGASAIATADGSIVYTAPQNPGTDTISYTVEDGGGKTTKHTLSIDVEGRTGKAVAPKAQADYVHVTVGQPLTFSPLANDLPGSDPLTPDATLRMAGVIKSVPGLQVSPPDAQGAVTLTANQAGPYKLTYNAGYGSAPTSSALIQVEATTADQHADVVAGPDEITVRGQASTLLDPLTNDSSPSGGLLTVVGVADVPDDLQVAVVRGRWLRVNQTTLRDTTTSETFTYSVTDGTTTATAQVTVVEMPAMDDDQPVAVTDYATVRQGDSVTISPLDNDIDPSGESLNLVQTYDDAPTVGQLVVTGSGAAGQKVGSAYVSGNQIRYVAPAADAAVTTPQQVTITYIAQNDENPAGRDTGEIFVTINPVGRTLADTVKADQAPAPPDLEARVVAGGQVTIPVPTSGVDPDGDSVQVQGLALPDSGDPQPRLGAVVAYTADSLTYQAYPSATNAGTDVFTYQVTDTFGVTAQGTVRVAVVQPTVLPKPVAHNVTVTAAPGNELFLDVVTPKYVDYPDGAAPTLLDPKTLNPDSDVASRYAKHPGWLDIKLPKSSPTNQVAVSYAVQADGGDSSSGTITVDLVAGYKIPPVVVDEFARPEPKATSVVVDLLAGDYSPTGQRLSIVPQADVSGSKLTVTLTGTPQVIPFTVKDAAGATASAVVYVPATGADSVPYWNGKTITIPEAKATPVEVAGYVSDPLGRSLSLVDKAKKWTSPQPGLAGAVTSATTLQLTGAAGYQGPASVTFAVTATDDLNAYTLITVPVIIGHPDPVLRCPDDVFTIKRGVQDLTFSPGSQCHVWTPPSADVSSLKYHLAWQKDPGLVAVSTNDAAQDVLQADHNAKVGSAGVLTVTIDGYPDAVASRLNVQVVEAPPMTIAPISVQGVLTTGDPTVINLKSAVSSPFGFDDVSILSVGTIQDTQITHDKGTITIKSTKKELHGKFKLPYTVTDVADPHDNARQKSGNITIQFIGVPDAPTGVTPVPGFRSQQVVLRWQQPPSNGATIDHYEVHYTSTNGHPSGEQDCGASNCPINNLQNGGWYKFQVDACNIAGCGQRSGNSPVGKADVKPDAVAGFAATTPAKSSGVVNLSWMPRAGLSSTEGWVYTITWSGGATTQATSWTSSDPGATSHQITGLDNDTKYTFTITAHNEAGDSPAVSTTGESAGDPPVPMWPSGAGFEPEQTAGGKYTVSLNWDAVPDPNGPRPVTYTLRRSGATDPVCVTTATTCEDKDFTENGKTYTYTVTAANTVNTGAASTAQAVEWSTPPDQMAAPTVDPVKPADPDGTVTLHFTTKPSHGQTLTVKCAYTTDGSTPTTSSTACPQSDWSGYAAVGGTSDSKTLTGVGNGKDVRFVVWEDNGASKNTTYRYGPASDASAAVTTNAPPTTPTAQGCGLSGNSVVYTWSAVTGTNGRTVDYQVSGDTSTTTNDTSVTVSHTQDYESHTIKVVAVEPQSPDSESSFALSITCADRKPPAPPAVSNLNCSVNNTTITWTWTNPSPPNSNVSYHVTLSNATTISNDGMANSWSNSWGQNGTGYTLTVNIVDNGGQSSSSSSKQCTEPAPPSISASQGDSGTGSIGTCKDSTVCHWLNFSFSSNFPAGTYSWKCISNGSVSYDSSVDGYTVSAGPNVSYSGTAAHKYCIFGVGVTEAIEIDGVESNGVPHS